jgi:L-threonylcarbamoyladenylate synthase
VILLSESIERVEPLLVGLDTTIRNQVIESWEKSAQNQRAHTWLLPINNEIPAWIYGDHDRVAIRVTQHPLCQQLCQDLDDFVVSTSANPAGLSPALSADEVQKYFSDQVAILSGELGDSLKPSRIVDAVTGVVIRG